jgi:hypothetical protein
MIQYILVIYIRLKIRRDVHGFIKKLLHVLVAVVCVYHDTRFPMSAE